MKRIKRTHNFIRSGLTLAVLLTFSIFTAAQSTGDDQPLYGDGAAFARITVMEGSATVSRENAGNMNASLNFTIEPLDVLATQGNGRAVVQFIDGTLLKLDQNTRVEFLEIGSSDNGKNLSVLARLWNGAILVDVSDDSNFQERSFRVDTEDSSIYFLSNGKYRLDRTGSETTLKVISGTAEMSENDASTLFHSGEMGRASRGYNSISKSYFNTFDMDNFDMWARNTYDRRPAASAQYVPTEIRHYVTELDSNGTWYYDTSLATYVWHPNIVDTSWSPYSNGYWAWSPYGMTWTSYYNWGFAPFHYGAWDFSLSFGWVWIPGRYYSPAWVSWNCWDSYIGWYPYNRHYYRRYHRGQRAGRYRRHHRVVYTTVDRFTSRRNRLTTRELPSGRNVTRATRPIVVNPRQLSRQSREAVHNAVTRPITRQIVQKQRITTRDHATNRITRGFHTSESRSLTTRRQTANNRITVRNPTVRNSSSIVIRRKSTRSGRTSRENIRSGNHVSNGNRTGAVTSGRNITVRTPVIKSRNQSTGNTNGRTIRQNRSNTNSRAIQHSNSPSRSIHNSSGSEPRVIRTPRQNSSNLNMNRSYSRSITVTRPSHSSVPSRSSRSYTRPVQARPAVRRPSTSSSPRSYTRPTRTTPTVSRPGNSRSTRSYSRPAQSTSHKTTRSSSSHSARSTSRSSSSGSRVHRH